MRINQKLQLGLLFTLYLCRSGKTTVDSAAEGLGVSVAFLQQVARTLRLAGVVRSTKGPTGGYELNGEPTVGAVFKALAKTPFATNASRLTHEGRALNHLSVNLTAALNPVLNRRVRSVGMDLVANGAAQLSRLSPSARVN